MICLLTHTKEYAWICNDLYIFHFYSTQALRAARAAQVHRFTAAAFHHMCAVKIQRTYRNYRMRELARQRMHSIIYIQVSDIC